MDPAPLEPTDHGLVPNGVVWFVLNARYARWRHAAGRGAIAVGRERLANDHGVARTGVGPVLEERTLDRLLEGSLGHLHAPAPFAVARMARSRRCAGLLALRRVLAETVTTFPPRQTTTGTSARSCKTRASRAAASTAWSTSVPSTKMRPILVSRSRFIISLSPGVSPTPFGQ